MEFAKNPQSRFFVRNNNIKNNKPYNHPIYVFGYGSLVNDDSLIRTILDIKAFSAAQINSLQSILNYLDPSSLVDFIRLEEESIPCRVTGLKRGWYAQGDSKHVYSGALSSRPTYLGVIQDAASSTNGSLVRLNKEQLD